MIQGPRENERYFCLTKVTRINFDDPEKARHKVHFDNLTPLYPDERLQMETPIDGEGPPRPGSSTWWPPSAKASAR